MFQFLNGAIRILPFDFANGVNPPFQFLNGAIRIRGKTIEVSPPLNSFNS